MDKEEKQQKARKAVAAVFLAVSVIFIAYVLASRFLPLKYVMILVFGIALLNLAVFFLLLTEKKRWKTILGIVLMTFSIAVFALTGFALKDINRFIHKVSSPVETDHYSVIVMKDNPYVEATEVKRENIGLFNSEHQFVIQRLLPNNRDYELHSYANCFDLVEALYDGKEQIILIDEAFRDMICGVFRNFNIETRILASTDSDIALKLERDGWQVDGGGSDLQEPEGTDQEPEGTDQEPEPGEYTEHPTKDVSEAEPFTLLISGLDTAGSINKKARSDVNIVMAVNPKKNEILMVPIPRDAYVTIAGTGYKDKLTHAGVLGIEVTRKTVANALGMPIDVYVKVNFNTLEALVDLLGGITIENTYAFTDPHNGYSFPVGRLRLDGKQALRYSRERYALPGGDRDRGKNQTRVIKGIIDETIKPSNLIRFGAILEQMSDSFVTDLSDQAIRSIIQEQIANGGAWTVNTLSLKAYGRMGLPSYMMPRHRLYFAVLDEKSVAHARSQLLAVLGD